jgi:teichuronic acid biosynthesis glycosyltransferase TuaC
MKILYITNHLNGNDGWSRYGLDIINEIIKTKGVFCLVNKKSETEKKYEKAVFGGPLEYIYNPVKSFLAAKKVNKVIKDFNPDVVHFLVEPYITMLPFLRIKKETKVVLTIHGTYAYFPNLFDNKFKKIISSCLFKVSILKVNKIISVSEFTKGYLLQNIKFKKFKNIIKEKIAVITNGINIDNINLVERRTRDNSANIKNILFVGTIKSRKGILESIEALREYKDKFSDNFIYNIVGSYKEGDDYYKKATKKVEEYSLKGKIFFRGRASDEELEKYYEKSDLFLMLPINDGRRFEGFGLVYLEAGSRGIPCIGSDDSGAREAILDGKTGYLVAANNSKKIAKKIDFILNKEKIKKENCINWANQNDIKNKVDFLLSSVYEKNYL